jgi:putative transposase
VHESRPHPLPANRWISFPDIQLLSAQTLLIFGHGYATLEDALERARLRHLFVVSGYVVMPEHVHLLVNEPQRGLLSRAVQALKLSVSVRSLERPFWQAHYYDRNVPSHEEFVEKVRYIHRNPVKRGLVEKPEDWKWSSYQHYQTGIRGTVEIESEWTAKERGWNLPDWMRYRESEHPSPVPKSKGPGAPSR